MTSTDLIIDCDTHFRRQVLGSFWFEQEAMKRVTDLTPDNVMFESDFPHPTSLSPGPLSTAGQPAAMARTALAGVPDDMARKVLYENAATLYHL